MIVTDSDLQDLLVRPANPLLTNFDTPKNWQDDKSLVQPCSLDLHIGAIFQPGVKPGKPGSAGNPKFDVELQTGQTAIIETQELIHVPGDYAAFGFPPSNVSSRALLMTNPGHIDPGYSGRLHFTVINMGREDFRLRKKDLIVTLLVFKLSASVAADYAARNVGHVSGPITQASIDLLSPDFVDVQKRATYIAKKTLGFTTAGAAILALILGWAFNQIDKRLNGIDDIQQRLTRVEAANTYLATELQSAQAQMEKQIELDRRLTVIESGGKTKDRPK
jgi:deoxycytidine triphosphate deaminase